MYPIIQQENKEFRIVGRTTIPQLGCCDENEQNIIKAKKDQSEFYIEFLKLKSIRKFPKGFVVVSEKTYYYEDGEFKESPIEFKE